MDLIEGLMKLGFTRQESTLYITLCKEGELTGYEAAKICGIQRSNCYLALAGLEEKGGVYRIEGDAVKYLAVTVKELAANLKRQFKEVLEYLEENAPHRNETIDSFITISGRSHIVDKMKNIVIQAKERVYVSMAPEELKYIENELKLGVGRGLKVVIITSPGFKLEGVVSYHTIKQPGQIRLIADSGQVLTGELSENNNTAALYSKNRNLVQLIKDSLTNEIKLIEIMKKDTRNLEE